jgi:hypothetical protein
VSYHQRLVLTRRTSPCLYSILVVGGAGTIGCSTALHLRRRGYTNLKLIDSYPFPSGGSGNSQSAGGSDLNKIVGYADGGVRGELAEETMRGWREDPVFREHYYEVGEVSLDVPVHILHMTYRMASSTRSARSQRTTARTSFPSIQHRLPPLRIHPPQDLSFKSTRPGSSGMALHPIRYHPSSTTPKSWRYSGMARYLPSPSWVGGSDGCD